MTDFENRKPNALKKNNCNKIAATVSTYHLGHTILRRFQHFGYKSPQSWGRDLPKTCVENTKV